MKINEHTRLTGSKVILVPYEKHHVPKYHKWMQSEELRLLTASEALTIEKEYEMQSSWRNDEDKCTFIILDRATFEATNNEIDSMVGDTNLFINIDDPSKAEIEIMIAEEKARKKGLGLEATMMMMLYGLEDLHLKTYEAKISLSNEISINMFKKLSFEESGISEVFQEMTLTRQILENDSECYRNLTNMQMSYY